MNISDPLEFGDKSTPLKALIQYSRFRARSAWSTREAEEWAIAATVIENATNPGRFLLVRLLWFVAGVCVGMLFL
jgi:hypothetical protein